MPLDVIIDYPCRVKRDLGAGDLRVGTRLLHTLLLARDKTQSVRANAIQSGRSAEEIVVTVVRRDAAGNAEEYTATVGELDAKTAALDPHIPACTNCPANALRRSFGCVGGLPYPVPKAAEKWALDHVQPPDTIGGAICLQYLSDEKISGEKSRDHRARGLFEAFPGLRRALPANSFASPHLGGDELFEPLLLSNEKMPPWMSLNVLLWFGVVQLDEKPVATAAEAAALTRLEPADRIKRAKLSLGSPPTDVTADVFRGLLKTLFVAWARDLEIIVDS